MEGKGHVGVSSASRKNVAAGRRGVKKLRRPGARASSRSFAAFPPGAAPWRHARVWSPDEPLAAPAHAEPARRVAPPPRFGSASGCDDRSRPPAPFRPSPDAPRVSSEAARAARRPPRLIASNPTEARCGSRRCSRAGHRRRRPGLLETIARSGESPVEGLRSGTPMHP